VSGTGPGQLGYGAALLPLVVPFAVLLPHRDTLHVWLRVTQTTVLPKCLVKVSQLLIKLASSLGELVEACLLTVDFGTPSYEFTVNICTY
jgi:hypothetical protein